VPAFGELESAFDRPDILELMRPQEIQSQKRTAFEWSSQYLGWAPSMEYSQPPLDVGGV